MPTRPNLIQAVHFKQGVPSDRWCAKCKTQTLNHFEREASPKQQPNTNQPTSTITQTNPAVPVSSLSAGFAATRAQKPQRWSGKLAPSPSELNLVAGRWPRENQHIQHTKQNSSPTEVTDAGFGYDMLYRLSNDMYASCWATSCF